jgi:ABC-2 type transport system permease protein
MARCLVQLKLRLLRNALHSPTAAQVSFLLSTTLAILVAIGTFVVLALYRGQSVSVDVTSVTFTVFAFGWLILACPACSSRWSRCCCRCCSASRWPGW